MVKGTYGFNSQSVPSIEIELIRQQAVVVYLVKDSVPPLLLKTIKTLRSCYKILTVLLIPVGVYRLHYLV